MKAPTLSKTLFSDDGKIKTYKVTVSWEFLTGNQMGGSPISQYKLFWNMGIPNQSTDTLLASGITNSYQFVGAVTETDLKKPF
jgi:hypothetical protein